MLGSEVRTHLQEQLRASSDLGLSSLSEKSSKDDVFQLLKRKEHVFLQDCTHTLLVIFGRILEEILLKRIFFKKTPPLIHF